MYYTALTSRQSWSSHESLRTQLFQKVQNNIHWKRRISIRVALRILHLDPFALQDQQEFFLSIYLRCLIGQAATLEHEYMTLFLNNPFNTHPLIECVPCPKHEGKVHITEEEFMAIRIPFLEGELKFESYAYMADTISATMQNLAGLISKQTSQPSEVTSVLDMMSEMREILQVCSSSKGCSMF